MNVGKSGENLACSYLKAKNYQILERNFRIKVGEIDIVARQGKYLVFCEVKTRRSCRFGEPFEAVTTFKQKKLKTLASQYLAFHSHGNLSPRFDVISISFSKRTPIISHIENAF